MIQLISNEVTLKLPIFFDDNESQFRTLKELMSVFFSQMNATWLPQERDGFEDTKSLIGYSIYTLPPRLNQGVRIFIFGMGQKKKKIICVFVTTLGTSRMTVVKGGNVVWQKGVKSDHNPVTTTSHAGRVNMQMDATWRDVWANLHKRRPLYENTAQL